MRLCLLALVGLAACKTAPEPTVSGDAAQIVIQGGEVWVRGVQAAGTDEAAAMLNRTPIERADGMPLVRVDPQTPWATSVALLAAIGRAGHPHVRFVCGLQPPAGRVLLESVAGFAPEAPNALMLTVAVAASGLYVAAVGGLPADAGGAPAPGGPTFPRIDGALDVASLRAKLTEVKGQHPDDDRLIVALALDRPSSELCQVIEATAPLFADIVPGQF